MPFKPLGNVTATFEFDDEKLGRTKFTCVLDGLNVDVVWQQAKEYTIDEILDMPLVCFGPDNLMKMVLRESKIIKDDSGKYGKVRKVKEEQ